MSFRTSAYIDFNTGIVQKPPMFLQWERKQPWSFEDKLDLFECMVDVWQLGPAVEILKQIEAHQPPSIWSHAAYALLATVFNYFEMIGKTLNPNARPTGPASIDFNYGFCNVYPAFAVAGLSRADQDLPDVRGFRDRIRNGLYHLGSTKWGSLIHNNPSEIERDFHVDKSGPTPVYYVNPHQTVRTIVAHFPTFMAMLRQSGPNSEALQTQFVQFFDDFHR